MKFRDETDQHSWCYLNRFQSVNLFLFFFSFFSSSSVALIIFHDLIFLLSWRIWGVWDFGYRLRFTKCRIRKNHKQCTVDRVSARTFECLFFYFFLFFHVMNSWWCSKWFLKYREILISSQHISRDDQKTCVNDAALHVYLNRVRSSINK